MAPMLAVTVVIIGAISSAAQSPSCPPVKYCSPPEWVPGVTFGFRMAPSSGLIAHHRAAIHSGLCGLSLFRSFIWPLWLLALCCAGFGPLPAPCWGAAAPATPGECAFSLRSASFREMLLSVAIPGFASPGLLARAHLVVGVSGARGNAAKCPSGGQYYIGILPIWLAPLVVSLGRLGIAGVALFVPASAFCPYSALPLGLRPPSGGMRPAGRAGAGFARLHGLRFPACRGRFPRRVCLSPFCAPASLAAPGRGLPALPRLLPALPVWPSFFGPSCPGSCIVSRPGS